MDFGLKGKTAWVMGGSSGLGLAIAQALATEGARIVLSSRSRQNLEAAKKKIKGDVDIVPVDLLKEEEIRKGAEMAGAVDILVSNTGGPAAGFALNLPLSAWDEGYYSLLRSVIQLCQLTVPKMKERRWGRILNVTSTSSREIIPKLPISSAFRSGLTAFVKQLAKEVGRDGVLVNNLLPGPTNTERLLHLKKESPAFYESMANVSALGRVGEPDEIGRVAAFICSNANTFITGSDVLADGGYTSAL